MEKESVSLNPYASPVVSNGQIRKSAARRRPLWIGVGAILFAAAPVWLYDGTFWCDWVGHNDLEIEFVVVNKISGKAINHATIAIQLTGGGLYRDVYEKTEPKKFSLVTAADGTARRVCHESMCFGMRSGLGFTDTYGIHLPWWRCMASAPAYGTAS